MTDRRPDPLRTIELQEEACVLAMLCCGEARGEQDRSGRLESVAMAGVLWVVRNRQQRSPWAGMSLKDIALQRWQFSCFNRNDPNRDKLLDLWRHDPVTWERADTVCDLVEAGFPDPTGGATHYCTAPLWNVARVDRARWHDAVEILAGRTVERARIGGHVFAVAP